MEKKIRFKLGKSEKYLCAQLYDDDGILEIDVVVEEEDGTFVQDVVQVRQAHCRPDGNAPIKDVLRARVFEDCYRDDHTQETFIQVYNDDEETTNI